MTYETITLDVADKIATITLNRPERMNACSLEMAGEINDAVSSEQAFIRSGRLRVIVAILSATSKVIVS